MTVPLLQCDDARVDVDGVPVLDGLSFATQGDRVGLLGDWGWLFRVLARQAEVSSGGVLVHGYPANTAVADGVVGLSLHDPGSPEGWTGLQYLQHSARLAGLGADAADGEARTVLERVGLLPSGHRKLGALAPVERRALLLTHVALGSPPVIALEGPLAGLHPAWAEHMTLLLARLAPHARWLVSVHDPGLDAPERALLDRLDEVLWLRGGVVSRTTAAQLLEPRSGYSLVVTRNAAALRAELRQRGHRVELEGGSAQGGRRPVVSGEPTAMPDTARLAVDVEGDGRPDAIVDAALTVDAPIVELRPRSET